MKESSISSWSNDALTASLFHRASSSSLSSSHGDKMPTAATGSSNQRSNAEVRPRLWQDHHGTTPLHVLCRRKVTSHTIQTMLQVMSKLPQLISVTDEHGQLPLHCFLQNNIADDSDDREPIVWYLPQLGSCKSTMDIIQMMLDAYPAALHVRDRATGMTPLLLACQSNVHLDIIYSLMVHDPACIVQHNHDESDNGGDGVVTSGSKEQVQEQMQQQKKNAALDMIATSNDKATAGVENSGSNRKRKQLELPQQGRSSSSELLAMDRAARKKRCTR
mmetsp:Transcript_28417/g.79986  ORF Transcript_28417/g.79986 Transcript_28417/m.79986 type:complete len:276 (+) Transcript_28417:190-1017(+)